MKSFCGPALEEMAVQLGSSRNPSRGFPVWVPVQRRMPLLSTPVSQWWAPRCHQKQSGRKYKTNRILERHEGQMSPAVPQSVLDENVMELEAVQEGKEGRRTGRSLETSSQQEQLPESDRTTASQEARGRGGWLTVTRQEAESGTAGR